MPSPKDLLLHDVSRLFVDGTSLSEIPAKIAERRGTTLIPNDVYRLLRESALQRHLSYRPREYLDAAAFIERHLKELDGNQTLREVQVVYPSVDAVATAVAGRVYELILDRIYAGKYETTLSVSGGLTTARVIDKLYSLLLHPDPRMQKVHHGLRSNRAERIRAGKAVPDLFRAEQIKLCFRSLVPLFETDKLERNPNASLLIFKRREFSKRYEDVVEISCVGAPGLPWRACGEPVAAHERETYERAASEARKSHILITSGSGLSQSAGMLRELYRYLDCYEEIIRWYTAQRCIGNFAVFPVTAAGPLADTVIESAVINGQANCPIYPNTLLHPDAFPEMIANGCEVILAMHQQTEDGHDELRGIMEMATRLGYVNRLFCTLTAANAFGYDQELEFGDFLNQGVARHFSQGKTPPEIQERLKHDVVPSKGRRGAGDSEIGRQAIYKVLDRANFHEEIVYRPSACDSLADQLERRYGRHCEIHVAERSIAGVTSVTTLTAEHVYRLIFDRVIPQLEPHEAAAEGLSKADRDARAGTPKAALPVAVGFAGGRIVTAVIEALYQRFLHPDDAMIELHRRLRQAHCHIKLHFQGLVPMIEPTQLELSPTGSLVAFNDWELRRQKEWLTISTAGVVGSIGSELSERFGGELRQEAQRQRAEALDIVITSACSLKRTRNLLKYLYADQDLLKQTKAWLEKQGVFGSMLLYPITPTGALPAECLHDAEFPKLYPNTLLKPWQLKDMVKRGAEVLLMLSGEVTNPDDQETAKEIVREEAELLKLACAHEQISQAFIGTAIAHELLSEF